MEKQFISLSLARQAEAVRNSKFDSFTLMPQEGQVFLSLFSGTVTRFTCVYDTEDQALHDIALLQEVTGELRRIPFPGEQQQPAQGSTAANVVNGVTLPADAKLGTAPPQSVKNIQLAGDIEGFDNAGLTAYEIGVNQDDKYRLLLYRGNSVAFEYLYNLSDDRANDMAVVLGKLPNLQHVGGGEFVS